MLRNIIGPSFDSKKCVSFNHVLARFSLKSHSPCRKKNIFEKKQKKEKTEKIGPKNDSKKAIFGPSFDSTAYMLYKYIYIYIHIRSGAHIFGHHGLIGCLLGNIALWFPCFVP